MSVGIRFMAYEDNDVYDDESNIIGQALMKLGRVKDLEIISLTRESDKDGTDESRMIVVYVDEATYRAFRTQCLLANRDGSDTVHSISCSVLRLGKDILEKIETTACDFYLCIFPDSFAKDQYRHHDDEWLYADTVYQLKLERYAEWLNSDLLLIPYAWEFSSTLFKPRSSLDQYDARPRYYFYGSSFCRNG